MTAALAARPRRLAASGGKRCGTGCWPSTPRGRPAWWTARLPATRRCSPRRTGRHLLEIVESGPIPAVHGVVRWRLIDLAQWVFEEFRIAISKQTLSRELRAL